MTDLDLLLVGLSHRTASVEVRERCAVDASELAGRLQAATALEGVREALLLSTCNRTELLLVGPDDERLRGALRELVFRSVPDDALYVYRGISAVIHLFRVVGGLDSLVLGESQILAQVKQAAAAASEAGTLGELLQPLCRQALAVGKRVRNETAVGRGSLSVARVGVDIAARAFGRFDDCSAVIVGAGETAKLVARHLRDGGVERLAFANRTPERASEAALEFGAEAAALDALPALVQRSDVIVACVEGAPSLVAAQTFDRRALAKRDRPAVVLDLSVPRAIDPSVAELRGLLYYDLDHLSRVVDENQREREKALEGSAELLVGEVHKFLALRTFAAFTPAVTRMRERFDEVREDVLDGIDAPGAKELAVAHELTRRLLDVALSQMKEGARRARPEEELTRAYRRFLEEL